jgi:hypothetical protein
MKCSNCSNEMVRSRAGWLCISCGHIEADTTADPINAQITLGKDSHDQMRNVLSTTDEPVDKPAPEDDKPVSPDAPVADSVPAPPPLATPPWEPPTTTVVDDSARPSDSDAATEVASSDDATQTPAPSAEDLSAVEAALAKVETPPDVESETKTDTESSEPVAASPEKSTEPALSADQPDEAASPDADAPVADEVEKAEPVEAVISVATPEPTPEATHEDAPVASDPKVIEPSKEPVPESEPEPVKEEETSQDKPVIKDDPSPEPSPEPQSEVKDEPKPDADVKAEPEVETKSEPEAKAEPHGEVKPESAKADAEAKEPEEAPSKVAHDLQPKQHRSRLHGKKTGAKFLVKDVSAPVVPLAVPTEVKVEPDLKPDIVEDEPKAKSDPVTPTAEPEVTPPATPSQEAVAPSVDAPAPDAAPVEAKPEIEPTEEAVTVATPEAAPESPAAPAEESNPPEDPNQAPETLEEVEHDESAPDATTSTTDETPAAVTPDALETPAAEDNEPATEDPELPPEEPLVDEADEEITPPPADSLHQSAQAADAPASESPEPKGEDETQAEPVEPPVVTPSSVADDVPAVAAVPDAENPEPLATDPAAEASAPETPVTESTDSAPATDPATAPVSADAASTPFVVQSPADGQTPPPSTDAVPVASTTDAAQGGKPPLKPVTHPAPFKLGPLHLVGALIVVVMIALLVYVFFIQPKLAVGNYLQKVATARTTSFSATIAESSTSYNASGNVYGVTDMTTPHQAKVIVNVTGSLAARAGALATGSNAVSGPVSAELLAVGPTLYFNTSTSAVVSGALAANLSPGWYKYDLGSAGSCASPGNGPGSFLSYGVFSKLPVKNAAFAGIGKFGNTWALTYRGDIDTASLTTAIAKANFGLSAACKIKIPVQDYKNLEISYKLWRGFSSDRLQVTTTDSVTGAATDILLTTLHYNAKDTIHVPVSAKNADNLFKKVLGASTYRAPLQTVSSSTSEPAPANQSLQVPARESNLAAYLNGYKAISDNGYFPDTPPNLSVQIEDPTTGQPYIVSTSPLTGVGQIQYIPGGSCSGPGVTPGKTGTRYLALKLLPSPTSAPYCLDVR